MSLPEKDKNLSNKEQGVYRKFIVSRADGQNSDPILSTIKKIILF
mgnify:CR=1 FL=1